MYIYLIVIFVLFPVPQQQARNWQLPMFASTNNICRVYCIVVDCMLSVILQTVVDTIEYSSDLVFF